jgi:hypothetical protein
MVLMNKIPLSKFSWTPKELLATLLPGYRPTKAKREAAMTSIATSLDEFMAMTGCCEPIPSEQLLAVLIDHMIVTGGPNETLEFLAVGLLSQVYYQAIEESLPHE